MIIKIVRILAVSLAIFAFLLFILVPEPLTFATLIPPIFLLVITKNRQKKKTNIADQDRIKAVEPQNSSLFLKDFTILDLETTGFDFKSDEIIEIGAIKVRDLKVTQEFSTYCDPGIIIRNSEIHGITNDDVKGYDHASNYMTELEDFIGEDVIFAYNAPFDMTFINIHLRENKKNLIFDVLKFAKKVDTRPSFKLEDIKKDLNLGETSHRAIADCNTTLNYYKYLITQNKETPIEYMSSKNNLENIRKMRQSRLLKKVTQEKDFQEPPSNTNHPFFQKNIVFTGNLQSMDRIEAYKKVKCVGGVIQERITLKTNFLIIGDYDHTTTKELKAIEYNKRDGIEISMLHESEFLKLLYE